MAANRYHAHRYVFSVALGVDRGQKNRRTQSPRFVCPVAELVTGVAVLVLDVSLSLASIELCYVPLRPLLLMLRRE